MDRNVAPQAAPRPPGSLASTLAALVDVFLVAGLGLFGGYALNNTSGHTGMPVHWVKWFYLLMAIVGVALVRVFRGHRLNTLGAWALLCIGLAGLLSGLVVERLNIIVQYDEWVRRTGNP